MSIEHIWAQCAVRVACRQTTSRADSAAILKKIAGTYPSAIRGHIASLRRQIELLERHLPAEADDNGN